MTSMREECKHDISKIGLVVLWGKNPPHKHSYGYKCVVCDRKIRLTSVPDMSMQIHNHVRRHTAAELRAWWICKVMADPVPDIPF